MQMFFDNDNIPVINFLHTVIYFQILAHCDAFYHIYEFCLLKWQESESQQIQIHGFRKCIGFGLKVNLFSSCLI